MAESRIIPTVIWAHGFGVPKTDPVALAVAAETAWGPDMQRIELATTTDGMVTPYPLDEQANVIAEALKNAKYDPILIAHSQACLSAAKALTRGLRPAVAVMLAPPLAGIRERLTPLRSANGIIQRPDMPPVLATDAYWTSFVETDPLQLITDGLTLNDGPAHVIIAGEDAYLGQQTAEYTTLGLRVPDLQTVTIPGANHLFLGAAGLAGQLDTIVHSSA